MNAPPDRNEALKKLLELQFGFMDTMCLYAVTRLGVADCLRNGAAAIEDIARATGAQPLALYRTLRFLAGRGVFHEGPGRTFALTPISELLLGDQAGAADAFVESNTDFGVQAALELLPALRTGEVPFNRRFGAGVFEYLRDKPDMLALVERTWQAMHWPETAAILDACDFAGVAVFADIGGGHGHVVTEFLRRFPAARGVLFDAPPVIAQAGPELARAGIGERCQTIAGNFFDAVPVAADVYFLRHILHDWDDDQCLAILGNIARAARPGGRLLIAECLVEEPNVPGFGKAMDIEMLLFQIGRERTVAEYRHLLATAGFAYRGVTATASIVSVVEGRWQP